MDEYKEQCTGDCHAWLNLIDLLSAAIKSTKISIFLEWRLVMLLVLLLWLVNDAGRENARLIDEQAPLFAHHVDLWCSSVVRVNRQTINSTTPFPPFFLLLPSWWLTQQDTISNNNHDVWDLPTFLLFIPVIATLNPTGSIQISSPSVF